MLCRKKGGGRVAAREVLLSIPAVSNLIREGKTFQIPSAMQTGAETGMMTFESSLNKLVKEGKVHKDDADTFLGRKKATVSEPAAHAAPGAARPAARPTPQPAGDDGIKITSTSDSGGLLGNLGFKKKTG